MGNKSAFLLTSTGEGDLPLFGGESMDLRNFISKDALHLMFTLNGWKHPQTKELGNIAVFKPDFYETGHVIAKTDKAIIQAKGYTVVNYRGKTYSNVESLLKEHGIGAIEDFNNWIFEIEKEWVIFKGGEWQTSFTTLDKLPKNTKYRC